MIYKGDSVVFPEAFGFCGGVRAADQLMRDVSMAAPDGVSVYGLHHIVHNADVVRSHEAQGVTFVDEIDAIPAGSAVVISAHGVGPETLDKIHQNGSETFDATCPLVTRTHQGVRLARERKEKVLYVCHGKPGEVQKLHDEVAGMVGHLDYAEEGGTVIYKPVDRSYLELGEPINEDVLVENGRYRIITQTTLHADEALAYRAALIGSAQQMQPEAKIAFVPHGDVCRAVADRQAGVQRLFQLEPTRIVVVTDPTSKNGRGYVKQAETLAAGSNIAVHAVAGPAEAKAIEPKDGMTAITASASTPDETIAGVAAIFGSENIPPTDRSFTLPDSKPGIIKEKFGQLVRRLRLVSHD